MKEGATRAHNVWASNSGPNIFLVRESWYPGESTLTKVDYEDVLEKIAHVSDAVVAQLENIAGFRLACYAPPRAARKYTVASCSEISRDVLHRNADRDPRVWDGGCPRNLQVARGILAHRTGGHGDAGMQITTFLPNNGPVLAGYPELLKTELDAGDEDLEEVSDSLTDHVKQQKRGFTSVYQWQVLGPPWPHPPYWASPTWLLRVAPRTSFQQRKLQTMVLTATKANEGG